MPDAYSQREPSPAGWDEAFAALPAEMPPGDGWSRLSARLDARRRPRWVQRFAIAAAVLVTFAAGFQLVSPGCCAATRTNPPAVKLRLAPVTTPGPDRFVKATGKPLAAVALKTTASFSTKTEPLVGKKFAMVWSALLMIKLRTDVPW